MKTKRVQYGLLGLATLIWASGATATEPASCPDASQFDSLASELSVRSPKQERLRHAQSKAAVSFVSRQSLLVIWEARSRAWFLGVAGSALNSGDAVCLVGIKGNAKIRWWTDDGIQSGSLNIDSDPWIVPGKQPPKASQRVADWLAQIDWPSSRQIAAIERADVGSRPRRRSRTGATRAMSVGSTPRAVYLRQSGELAQKSLQKLLPDLEFHMWGWCESGVDVAVFNGQQSLAEIKPYSAFVHATIMQATQVKVTLRDGDISIPVEWTRRKDLPLPKWIRKSESPLFEALWLAEHESGEYEWLGYSMLHQLAATDPAALHYLVYKSDCGRGYTYWPDLRPSVD